jgi:NAD(P)-dependent dehydrogenase (short-subunit alcohol dehydrogenase family)
MNQDGSFAGKVAFVTGAASGIGHAAALASARGRQPGRLAVGRTVPGCTGLPADAAAPCLTGQQPPLTSQTASRLRVSSPNRPTDAPAPRLDASP